MKTMQLAVYAVLFSTCLALEIKQHHLQTKQEHLTNINFFVGAEDAPTAKDKKFEKTTADDGTCYIIYVIVFVGFTAQVLGQLIGIPIVENSGCLVGLVGGIWAVVYSYQHGLMSSYWNGTIDMEKHKYCAGVGVCAIVWLGCCTCICCLSFTVVVMTKMKVDKEQEQAKFCEPHQQAFTGDLCRHMIFVAKCREAFLAADADGNNKLDMSELQTVSLDIFDMSDRLKKVVKEQELWQQAFVENDKNKDKFIDQNEFIAVMEWLVVKAAAAADEGESKKLARSVTGQDLA